MSHTRRTSCRTGQNSVERTNSTLSYPCRGCLCPKWKRASAWDLHHPTYAWLPVIVSSSCKEETICLHFRVTLTQHLFPIICLASPGPAVVPCRAWAWRRAQSCGSHGHGRSARTCQDHRQAHCQTLGRRREGGRVSVERERGKENDGVREREKGMVGWRKRVGK